MIITSSCEKSLSHDRCERLASSMICINSPKEMAIDGGASNVSESSPVKSLSRGRMRVPPWSGMLAEFSAVSQTCSNGFIGNVASLLEPNALIVSKPN